MAYPSGVSLAIINAGNAFTAFGDGVSLTVSVTPKFPKVGGGFLARVVHAPSGWVMTDDTQEFKSEAGAELSFSAPHVDQPGFRDPAQNAYTGWYYEVRVSVGNPRGKTRTTYTQNVQPFTGQALIDLDLVPDGPVGEATYAPTATVTSVAGLTGAIPAGVFKGDQGEEGPPGNKGDKGDKGDPGEKGDTGASGVMATMTPSSTVPGAYEVSQAQDTGWRSLPVDTGSTGTLQVRRVGDRVFLKLVGVAPPAGSFAIHVGTIPVGFRYSGQHFLVAADQLWSAPASIYGMYSSARLSWLRTITNASTRPTVGQYAEYTFLTGDTWPTTLPGTAV